MVETNQTYKMLIEDRKKFYNTFWVYTGKTRQQQQLQQLQQWYQFKKNYDGRTRRRRIFLIKLNDISKVIELTMELWDLPEDSLGCSKDSTFLGEKEDVTTMKWCFGFQIKLYILPYRPLTISTSKHAIYEHKPTLDDKSSIEIKS